MSYIKVKSSRLHHICHWKCVLISKRQSCQCHWKCRAQIKSGWFPLFARLKAAKCLSCECHQDHIDVTVVLVPICLKVCSLNLKEQKQRCPRKVFCARGVSLSPRTRQRVKLIFRCFQHHGQFPHFKLGVEKNEMICHGTSKSFWHLRRTVTGKQRSIKNDKHMTTANVTTLINWLKVNSLSRHIIVTQKMLKRWQLWIITLHLLC